MSHQKSFESQYSGPAVNLLFMQLDDASSLVNNQYTIGQVYNACRLFPVVTWLMFLASGQYAVREVI